LIAGASSGLRLLDPFSLAPDWLSAQVVAMRSSQERNNRLENLCWRIWHVARKKKQVRRHGTKAELRASLRSLITCACSAFR
jgi:hypothetical protein